MLAAKAAFILFQIISSHPFTDGNKRTAYGSADFFLRLNGYSIKVEPQEALEFIVQIATGKSDESTVRKWVKTKRSECNPREISTELHSLGGRG